MLTLDSLLVISNIVAFLPFYVARTTHMRIALLYTAVCSSMSHSYENGKQYVYTTKLWQMWNFADVIGCAWVTIIMICEAYQIGIDFVDSIPGPLLAATLISYATNAFSCRMLRPRSECYEEYVIMHTFWHISIYVLLCDWITMLGL